MMRLVQRWRVLYVMMIRCDMVHGNSAIQEEKQCIKYIMESNLDLLKPEVVNVSEVNETRILYEHVPEYNTHHQNRFSS